MKVKIVKIEPGAEFDGMVWDYWVDAVLPNKSIVKLFDSHAFILISFVGVLIDLSVKALFIEKNENHDLIRVAGKIIKNEDGYFLIDELGTCIEVKFEDIQTNSISINQDSIFFLGRLDIKNVKEPDTEGLQS